MDKIEIGRNLRYFREKRKLSQEKLAEKVSLSTIYIAQIERGVKSPSLDTLIDISNILEVSTDELLGKQIKALSKVRVSKLSKKIQILPYSEQYKIFAVVDVMIANSSIG